MRIVRMLKLKQAIPSMFHRRLLLLTTGVVLVCSVLFAQLFRLSVVQGDDRLRDAMARLDRRTFLPTYRGRILDRYGRELARDTASYHVSVEFSVINESWSRNEAYRKARNQHGDAWDALSPEERSAAMERHRPEFDAVIDAFWRDFLDIADIDREELEARKDRIKKRIVALALHIHQKQREAYEQKFGDAAAREFKPDPILEQQSPHVILPRIDDEAKFAFARLAEEYPGMLGIPDAFKREYPYQTHTIQLDRSTLPKPLRPRPGESPLVDIEVIGVADHITGAVRGRAYKADILRRPFRDKNTGEIDLGGYRSSDAVGSRGIELVYEDLLRGLRGQIHRRVDTGQYDRTEHTPGLDVQLTIDVNLQARVQAVLSPEFGLTRVHQYQTGWDFPADMNGVPRPMALPKGYPLNSAAVVLDVRTGDILAMVSMPTVAMGETMTKEEVAINHPITNRPVEAIYPPGSIIKPLVLSAAVMSGAHNQDMAITCTGHYFPNSTKPRCWIYREHFGMRTHGPLVVEEALARSCNIYFYTLADRLGMGRLTQWYRHFGLGEPLDVGLLHTETTDGRIKRVGESGGNLPSTEYIEDLRAKRLLKFETVIAGIGQGPVTWTPVQAANAYAMLARRGKIKDASLIYNDEGRPRPREQEVTLDIDRRLVDRILEGLRRSVTESIGTGYQLRYRDRSAEPIIRATNVTVWAKTGTAQAAQALEIDTDGDGKPDRKVEKLDHAWFVGLVGPEGSEPLYAIAVVVEYGGSGGRTAGPIADQIIRALQAEHYLPGGES